MKKYFFFIYLAIFSSCGYETVEVDKYPEIPIFPNHTNSKIKIDSMNKEFNPVFKIPVGYLSFKEIEKSHDLNYIVISDNFENKLYQTKQKFKKFNSIRKGGIYYEITKNGLHYKVDKNYKLKNSPHEVDNTYKIKKYSFEKKLKIEKITSNELVKKDTIISLDPMQLKANALLGHKVQIDTTIINRLQISLDKTIKKESIVLDNHLEFHQAGKLFWVNYNQSGIKYITLKIDTTTTKFKYFYRRGSYHSFNILKKTNDTVFLKINSHQIYRITLKNKRKKLEEEQPWYSKILKMIKKLN